MSPYRYDHETSNGNGPGDQLGVRMYYRRYLDGEHEDVWKELNNEGERVFSGFLRQDAEDVAESFVDRLRSNILAVQVALRDVGYRFAVPQVITEASNETINQVDAIEQEKGRLPVVLKVLWQHIASIDLSQEEGQYESGSGPQCDGIVPFNSLSFLCPADAVALGNWKLDEIRAHNEYIKIAKETHPELRDELRFDEVDEGFIPLGSAATNCELKGFSLPCDSFDGRYYNEGFGDHCLGDDYRIMLKTGGIRFMFFGRHVSKKTGQVAFAVHTPSELRCDFLARLLPKIVPL